MEAVVHDDRTLDDAGQAEDQISAMEDLVQVSFFHFFTVLLMQLVALRCEEQHTAAVTFIDLAIVRLKRLVEISDQLYRILNDPRGIQPDELESTAVAGPGYTVLINHRVSELLITIRIRNEAAISKHFRMIARNDIEKCIAQSLEHAQRINKELLPLIKLLRAIERLVQS